MEENKDRVQNNGEIKHNVWQPLLLSAMVALGMLMGYKMNDKAERFLAPISSDKNIELGRIEEIIRFIESRYVDKVESEGMISEAINALLSKLDPHSLYIPPSEMTSLSENMDGNFNGIGVQTTQINDTAVITTIVDNSPAKKSDLKQFDQIIKVNDSLVSGIKLPFEKLKDKLRQKESVKLEIKRKGLPNTLIKVIKLENLVIHSADVAYMVKGDIGCIQIDQFTSNTYNEFMTNLEYLHDKMGMRNLIIDLRGNPGGYLPQATKIINQLIPEKEKLIVYTEGRNEQREDYLTNGKAFFSDINKIAVLVDEFSASGSEVIAGAIQDQDRGIIIGRKTFGKGLVQEQFNLTNGGAIRLTTARYFTPSGRCIQKDFTNLEDYENEVYERSLFVENKKHDSLKSKVFKTLIKGRKVYSAGGIDPEIFIKGDSLALEKDYYSLNNHAFEYIVNQILKNKVTLTTEPDFASLSKDFVEYVSSVEKMKSIKLKMLNQAQQKLKENYAFLKSNGDLKSKAKEASKNDKFVKSAVDYFEGRHKL